jgi:hypothetical protein
MKKWEASYRQIFKGHTVEITLKGNSVRFVMDEKTCKIPLQAYQVFKEYIEKVGVPLPEISVRTEKEVSVPKKAKVSIPSTPPGWIVRGRKAFDPATGQVYKVCKGKWKPFTSFERIKKVGEAVEESNFEEAAKRLRLTKSTVVEYSRIYKKFKDIETSKEEKREGKTESTENSFAKLLKKKVIS